MVALEDVDAAAARELADGSTEPPDLTTRVA
jgi:hypothetical protein